MSGGSVDIVTEEEMISAMTQLIQRKNIGTMGVISLFAPFEAVRVEGVGGKVVGKERGRGGMRVEVPVIDEKSDVCFCLELEEGEREKEEEGVVVQVQGRYIGKNQEEVLVVETKRLKITNERGVVEEGEGEGEGEGKKGRGVCCSTVGVTAVRRAAGLAAENKYLEARILLISTQVYYYSYCDYFFLFFPFLFPSH